MQQKLGTREQNTVEAEGFEKRRRAGCTTTLHQLQSTQTSMMHVMEYVHLRIQGLKHNLTRMVTQDQAKSPLWKCQLDMAAQASPLPSNKTQKGSFLRNLYLLHLVPTLNHS